VLNEQIQQREAALPYLEGQRAQVQAKAGERASLKAVSEEKKASQEARGQRIEAMRAEIAKRR
jgi:hypothetical protein